jgi:hypothetical protein
MSNFAQNAADKETRKRAREAHVVDVPVEEVVGEPDELTAELPVEAEEAVDPDPATLPDPAEDEPVE